MTHLQFHTPYRYERIHFWWWSAYKIFFDDTEILIVANREEARRLVAALNGAFNIGFGEGMNFGKLSEDSLGPKGE